MSINPVHNENVPSNCGFGYPERVQTTDGTVRPLVVCPLRFEMKMLHRAGLHKWCDLACCGPGTIGVQKWADATGSTDRPILLVGLAGAISDRIHAGTACLVDEVVDADSMVRVRPPLLVDFAAPNVRCALVTVKDVVETKADRMALHNRTGADLVDMESSGFALAAVKWGWNWGIIRGVSDDFETDLPRQAGGWVNEAGDTRWLAVARSILGNPAIVRCMYGLGVRSKLAMKAAANLVIESKKQLMHGNR